ncbi:CoA transferase [Orrella sp. JC864]|uniref:CaiB/BaiF CoA transferase family protein n=1 Tax=Orrella sp. JC864 TaxID=3120298 RepID=UPI00300BD878
MLQTTLDGVRVIDFSQIGAGPTCSMYLGDLGADVIKIEPPGGDLGRKLGKPWVQDESPVYMAFNRNKRSVCVDLKTPQGLQLLHRLAAGADVVVESFRPGVMQRLGLDYRRLSAANPRLVYCSVSAFGQTGPAAHKPGVDGIVQGESGLMSLIGLPDTEPCKVQAPVVDIATGFIATIGVVSALLARERSGAGAWVDTSLFASAIALQQSAFTEFLGSGRLPVKAGSSAPYAAPNEAFEAADGWLMVAAYNGGRWERLCEVLGLAGDPALAALADLDSRIEHRAGMRSLLAPKFRQRTVEHWLQALSAADIVCGRVADYQDLQDSPQLAHLNLVESIRLQDGRQFRVPAFPINSAQRERPSRPPPACGEHTVQVLVELGVPEEQIQDLRRDGVVFAAGDARG